MKICLKKSVMCPATLDKQKTDVLQANNNFWSPSSPTSSSSNNGKKRNVPLKANGSLDPLEVIKLAVHTLTRILLKEVLLTHIKAQNIYE
ncbi:910_t:CDS:2 [Funneliformis caledonium]|uniref:910_t:CDS:1 n=1 Tax=Funneliformis caledonium TaxID=1117310 RepID=A0A9N9AFN5_9GLOM|nr:910_t:CDS:2 [Funneliformis caledonium]